MPVGGLYDVLKGQAYGIASIASGRSNADAQALGFKDVYDLIMSDSDHDRQPAFLHLLMHEMPEAHRQVLLDGLANALVRWRQVAAIVEGRR